MTPVASASWRTSRQKPRHHPAGPEDPGEPGPSRRRGRRQADGRRRRHPDPDSRHPVPRRIQPAGHRAAAARRIRRGHGLPAQETASRLACEQELERSVRAEGQVVLGWRNVPVDVDMPMSPAVRDCEPVIRQLFIGRGADVMVPDALERKLYVIRKTASHAIQNMRLAHGKNTSCPRPRCAPWSKGLLLADQVGRYYRDLADPRTVSAWRWCTSASRPTPSPPGRWPTVPHDRPQRRDQHGQGQLQRLRAREGMMQSAVLGDDLKSSIPSSTKASRTPLRSTTAWNCW